MLFRSTDAEFAAIQQADKLRLAAIGIGEGFANSAQRTTTNLTQVRDRIGDVFGTISGGGKDQVIYYDKLTQSIEIVSQSTFNRLQAEQKITKQTQDQVTAFKDALSVLQGISKESKSARAPQVSAVSPAIGGSVFFPSNMLKEEQGNARIAEIARRNGGNYLRVLADVIGNGDPGAMTEAKLVSMMSDISSYRTALAELSIAQDQVTRAQEQYNNALSDSDIATAGANLTNAKNALDSVKISIDGVRGAFDAASILAEQLGVDIQSIPSVGEILGSNQVNTLRDTIAGIEGIWRSGEASNQANLVDSSLLSALNSASLVPSGFQEAVIEATKIEEIFNKLDGRQIEVFVTQTPITPGRFAGGPVTGGKKYTINEIGREGYLSAATGKLLPINRPANSTWTAPGAGTIVPAHIMDALNVPQVGVKANTNKPVPSNGLQQSMKTALAAMSVSGGTDIAINELSRVQANQAIQIGRLSRVVNKLAEKDWNVNVNVKAGNTANYLEALNRRL